MTGQSPKTKNQYLYKTGLVFGAFDPLHYGHIRLLKRASGMCKTLYACTETNEIIKTEKNRDAFTSEESRLDDLMGIRYLNGVYMRGNGLSRRDIVNKVKPDVLFLGSDWRDKDWEGKHFGIRVEYLERTPDVSSTLLREICR